MATYQEQIEQNKRRKEATTKQTMVDLVKFCEVGGMLSSLMAEGVITPQERFTILRRFADTRPNIAKHLKERYKI